MKIPVLSKESRESLITEKMTNQAAQVYQRLLELADDNRKLFDIIKYLADEFSTKEESNMAMLSMTAIVCLIEAEFDRVALEGIYGK